MRKVLYCSKRENEAFYPHNQWSREKVAKNAV